METLMDAASNARTILPNFSTISPNYRGGGEWGKMLKTES
jgi:hypothetical protein